MSDRKRERKGLGDSVWTGDSDSRRDHRIAFIDSRNELDVIVGRNRKGERKRDRERVRAREREKER